METFISKLTILEYSFLLFKSSVKNEISKGENSIIKDGKIKVSADLKNSNLKDYKLILHEFIPLTIPRIINFIDNNIKRIKEHTNYYFKNLKRHLKSLNELIKQEDRKNLPNLYQFDFQDEYSIPNFMANLRLCNRSAKRFIRNNIGKDLFTGRKQSRGCRFPSSTESALEKQEITSLNNRVDLVINSGTYEKIYKTIQGIQNWAKNKSMKSIRDNDIAFWIRQTLQGNKLDELITHNGYRITNSNSWELKELKIVIADITYLLFGTEAMRNPATLIHHNMMLDLIIEGHYGWNLFLIGDEATNSPILPMEIDGAVMCARALHTTYNRLMPYPYEYPKAMEAAEIQDPKVVKLIAREGELTLEWLKNCTKVKMDMPNSIIQQVNILNAIWYACKGWGYSDIKIVESDEIIKAYEEDINIWQQKAQKKSKRIKELMEKVKDLEGKEKKMKDK